MSSPDRLSPRVVRVLAAIGVALTASASVSAQQPAPPVVNRAVAPATPPRQAFGLAIDFSGGYDDNVIAELTDQRTGYGAASESGGVLGTGFLMNYRLNKGRGSFAVDAGARGRYIDFDVTGSTLTSYAGVSETFTGRTTRFFAAQGISRAPAYSVQNMSRDLSGAFTPAVPNLDRTIVAAPVTVADLSAGLTRQLGRRSTFSLQYEQGTTLRTAPGVVTGKALSTRAVFDRGVTRFMRVRLGYGFRRGESTLIEFGRRTNVHELNTGIGYSRPLSFSRRTTVGFDTGLAVAEQPGGRTSQFIGSFDLKHEFGRSWTAGASYRRGLGGLDRFTDTLFAHVVRGEVVGQLSPRVTSRFTGAYSHATPVSRVGAFESIESAGRVSVQLSRRFDWYGEGFYYQYSSPVAPVGATVPPTFDRYGVRVGVTLRAGSQSRQNNVAK